MRIAYIAPYQGASLVRRRPSLLNLSLGARAKIELISELLRRNSNEVEILSQAEVDKYEFRFYPSLKETDPFHPDIPAYYASAFPVRFICGFWSNFRMRRLLRARHKVSPYDLVIIYNMKRAQIACANYARQRLGLPVILDYGDDNFVAYEGDRFVTTLPQQIVKRLAAKYHTFMCRKEMKMMSGCMAVTPYLLSQLPSSIPQLLLRGVVSEEIVNANSRAKGVRRNWVIFSGTHSRPQGLEKLIEAWGMARLSDWELHIAGHGEMTATLEKLAENNRTIIFHGLVSREENARLLRTARIGVVPFDVCQIPGRGFAFKTIECLAAGVHVITTPMGFLEPELEAGITYMPDNRPSTIATTLKKVVENRQYERHAENAAVERCGPAAALRSLDLFLKQVMTSRAKNKCRRSLPSVIKGVLVRVIVPNH